MALFTAFLFFLLACKASAGSCAKKSCGDAFVTTSWNPERVYETVNGNRVSRDIYYYEVTTNGCGSEFTDLLLTIPTVCTGCSTLQCYNSAWQVIQCPSGASWTEYNALFYGLGVKNTSGHQWHFTTARTALRWSFTVDSATSYSKLGKLYIKGPSWAECNAYVPVCNCGCTPCPSKCYKSPNNCDCNNCTDCINGQYEILPCNATANRVCKNCTVCQGGMFQKAPCNATSDRTCQNCTVCRNGAFMKAPCNATSDTTCKNCTVCLNNQYMRAPCNATSDTTCTNCSVCLSGQYRTAPCNTTSDTTCKNCSVCLNGQYRRAACNATSDTTCSNCTVCLNNQFIRAPCNASSDTTCTNCSVCLLGQYRRAPCNATSDTSCSNCTVCRNGQYMRAPCNATSDTTCSNCSVCLLGQYRAAPCNTTSDTTCKNCSVCLNGQYQTAACNATSDTTCSSCTNCTAGSIQISPCNATHNAVCRPCSNCSTGFFESAPCNGTTDTICQPCSNCSNTEQVEFPCNATHDIVCVPCPLCANCTDPNSHLTNDGLNCTCNDGYTMDGEGTCQAAACCQDCESCGFNASQACFLNDPSLCDYSCFNATSQCTATTPFDTGYTVDFDGVSNDPTCCSDASQGCSCFSYDLGAGSGTYPLNDFFIAINCGFQLCDPTFSPPPCFESVTRFDQNNDPASPVTFFFQNDGLTNIPGIAVPGLDLFQEATRLTFIFQGNVTVGPTVLTYTANGTDAASGNRACLISSIEGPNCITCP